MSALPKDPAWLRAAYKDLGLKELPGARHSARILAMFRAAGHPQVKDDETAWCSAAMNAWMAEAGIRGTGKLTARSWLEWGRNVSDRPIPRGAVVVFKRGNSSWQGHVALCITDGGGSHITVLGGNQSNAVTVAKYPRSALLGARWPDDPKPFPPKRPEPAESVPDDDDLPPPETPGEPEVTVPAPPDIEPPAPTPPAPAAKKSIGRRIAEWTSGISITSVLGFLTDWRVVLVLALSGLAAGAYWHFFLREKETQC
jgi:uncharacterized protein (TIGR02594 family)